MWLLYLLVNNFGVAVILFTIIARAASFPLMLKQQKNMAVSQLFMPRVQEIQKKYRGNQQKMQEEMQKLQKEGYNPMGGCGPMILTMILLFGMLDVVYKPMTHVERFDKETIAAVQELGIQTEYTSIVRSSEGDFELFLEFAESEDVEIFKKVEDNPDRQQVVYNFDGTLPELKDVIVSTSVSNYERELVGEYVAYNLSFLTGAESRLSEPVKIALKGVDAKYRGLQSELHSILQYSRSPEAFSTLSQDNGAKLKRLNENMVFLGIHLGETPHYTTFNRLWLLAMLGFVFSVAQVAVQQFIQRRTMPEVSKSGGMKAMILMGPIITLFIIFAVPAGAGLYWSIGYLFGIAQSVIIYKFWPPERMREEARANAKIKNGMVDATAKIVDVDQDGNEVIKEEKLSDMSGKEQKEYFRKKLEEARKADLEKYGEVPDVDLSEYDKPEPEPDKQPTIDDEKPTDEGEE
ncbi:MAG: membrane protein insertase YidC [Oscillospiraceae bacterium]|nr:membrane protein insertase YidC [Oscillospiraceae bacterium]